MNDKILQDVKARVGVGARPLMKWHRASEILQSEIGIRIFKDNVKTCEEIEAKIMQKHKYCSYEWNYKR